jgi:hypothetical protein
MMFDGEWRQKHAKQIKNAQTAFLKGCTTPHPAERDVMFAHVHSFLNDVGGKWGDLLIIFSATDAIDIPSEDDRRILKEQFLVLGSSVVADREQAHETMGWKLLKHNRRWSDLLSIIGGRLDRFDSNPVALKLIPVEDAPDPLEVLIEIIPKFWDALDDEVFLVAVYVLYMYVYRQFGISPRLMFRSPFPGHGKSVGVDLLENLGPDPFKTDDWSIPSVVAQLDIGRPVLLDEGENADFGVALRKVYNSGHKRNGRRTIKNRTYSTYAPVVLAMIDERPLHQSMLRRSHIIELQRTRRDLELWRVEMHIGKLRQIHDYIVDFFQGRDINPDPTLPDQLRNGAVSARDNWRPLISVCDAIDAANRDRKNPIRSKWGARACEVAIRMSKRFNRHDLKVVMLYDIRTIFEERMLADQVFGDKISDSDLVAALNKHDNGIWYERLGGATFTRSKLKQMLAGFRREDGSPLVPGSIRPRPGARPRRGYARKWFDNAFARYLEGVNMDEDDGDDESPQLSLVAAGE